MAFCIWLIALNVFKVHPSCMYQYIIPFFWPNNIPLCGIYHIVFIHSSVEGQLDCFHFLAPVNTVAMNICVQFFVWRYIFNSSGYIPRNGIAGSCGN